MLKKKEQNEDKNTQPGDTKIYQELNPPSIEGYALRNKAQIKACDRGH